MSELSDFLLARFAEDEARARELQRRAQDVQLTLQDPNALGRWIPGWHDWPDVEALTARVLAKCEADRRARSMQIADELDRILAVPYADHPDYDERWRP